LATRSRPPRLAEFTPQPAIERCDQSLQPQSVAVMLNLQPMPGGVHIAKRCECGRLLPLLSQPRGSPWCVTTCEGHPSDDPSLKVGQSPLAAVRLDQSHTRDVVAMARQHVQKQIGRIIIASDGGGVSCGGGMSTVTEFLEVDKRHLNAETCGSDHDIDLFTSPVGKHHIALFKPFHAANGADPALIDTAIESLIDHRMAFPELMVRCGEPMPMWKADGPVDQTQ